MNLFAGIPADLPRELTDCLHSAAGVRIERIVSRGQVSPPGFWYDQDQDEWVVVLQGAARLRFEGEDPWQMGPGDHALIPAHRRHRVEWTDPEQTTVWLAVFCSS